MFIGCRMPRPVRMPTKARTVADQPLTIGGLDWPGNNQANSDARMLFAGSVLVSRLNRTVIWRTRPRAITGYQTETCHSPKTGTWDGGVHSVLFTGHPCDGTFDSTGQRQNGTGASGTVLYAEIAGMGAAKDFIASPASPGPQSTFLSVAGEWRRRASIIVPNGSNTDHFYYPDLANRPTEFIRQSLVTSSIGSGGSTPAFYWGGSDWRSGSGGAGTNDESIDGITRGKAIFQPALTNLTHVNAISACETDAQVLAYIAANSITGLFYLNMNPSPSDVTDKSGNGNHPSWDNVLYKPGSWSGTA